MSLELRELSKQVYGEVHIAQTELSLNPGVFNVLLGPTLSGKTSLMRLMAGLDQPSTGSVWFNGQNVTGIPVQYRNLAMVYQQFINFPNMSVFENIASPLRIQKLSESRSRPRVEKVAELLKLTPYMQRPQVNCREGSNRELHLQERWSKERTWCCLMNRWSTSTTSYVKSSVRNYPDSLRIQERQLFTRLQSLTRLY